MYSLLLNNGVNTSVKNEDYLQLFESKHPREQFIKLSSKSVSVPQHRFSA